MGIRKIKQREDRLRRLMQATGEKTKVKAIEQMKQNRPAYEPALEIIADEYDVDVEASHHEQMTTA